MSLVVSISLPRNSKLSCLQPSKSMVDVNKKKDARAKSECPHHHTVASSSKNVPTNARRTIPSQDGPLALESKVRIQNLSEIDQFRYEDSSEVLVDICT